MSEAKIVWELTDEKKTNHHGVELTRLLYYKIVDDVVVAKVKGGWIEKPENISKTARILDNVEVFGNAEINQNAYIEGNAKIFGNVTINDNVSIQGSIEISGDIYISQDVKINATGFLKGVATITNNAMLTGFIDIYCKKLAVWDNVKIHNSTLNGGSISLLDSVFLNNTYVFANDLQICKATEFHFSTIKSEDNKLNIGNNYMFRNTFITSENDYLLINNKTFMRLNKEGAEQISVNIGYNNVMSLSKFKNIDELTADYVENYFKTKQI